MERKLEYTAGKADQGCSVKEILREKLGLSARQISRAKFLDSGITVNGEKVTVRRLLNTGDSLEIILEDASSGSDQLIPYLGEPDIRYEDQDLLLVNKPAGLVVHPSPGHYADSLANMLVWYYGKRDEHLVVRPVGRLDRETSGLIFIAKNKASVRKMELERMSGELERHYLALVHGNPVEDEGVIEEPIGPDPDAFMRQKVREDGSPAKTVYRVISRYDSYSLVELRLFTGRTHQIRVHMAWLGHPLLGDSMYGRREEGIIGRAALHSWKICCTQPFTGKRLEFLCELPDDMRKLAGKYPKETNGID